MKKILILLLFCGFWANAQQYHDKGAKFEFATNEGDTITVNTRIPIIDEFGLINYYVDVADLLALNPAPVLEWGNITGTLSNQTDLQGALNNKADQSALTAHTSNGNIHFTQSAISITESQVSDLKDYLRGDVNDTNGANKLTLGSLEVVGQTTLQNGLNLTSIPVGTSNNILTINGTGDVEQRVFSLGDIDIANATGVSQFPVGLGDQLRIKGSGDTSISFDGITNTININSTPGSGGGGAVTSFNGRDGAVVSQAGDYSTAMVNENTNLYFTEARVRGTDLAGLTVTNTPISSTNTFIQALGRLQGQINNREVSFSKNTAFNKNFGTSAGTVAQGNDSRINNGQTAYSWGNHASQGYITGSYTGFDSRYVNVSGDTMTGGLEIRSGTFATPTLGSAAGSSLMLKGNTAGFGLNFTNNGDGKSFIQSQRFDGNTAVLPLILNGSGGGVSVGFNGTPNSTLQVKSSIGITGTGAGSANTASLNFYEENSATNQARLGFLGATNNFEIRNEVANNRVYLEESGDVNSLRFAYGSNFRVVYHSGNLRSDSQNDARYAIMNATNTGSLTVTGDVIANSDRRLKTNIKRIDNALAIVQLLGGYEYDRKDIDLHQAGVIAQEVEEVFPTAVSEDEKGIKSVAYNQLIALLIEAIKEQQIEIEQLKTLINEK